jgi:hypothetical protein
MWEFHPAGLEISSPAVWWEFRTKMPGGSDFGHRESSARRPNRSKLRPGWAILE